MLLWEQFHCGSNFSKLWELIWTVCVCGGGGGDVNVCKIKLSACVCVCGVCVKETETDVHAWFTFTFTPEQQGISSALDDIIKIIHIYCLHQKYWPKFLSTLKARKTFILKPIQEFAVFLHAFIYSFISWQNVNILSYFISKSVFCSYIFIYIYIYIFIYVYIYIYI